MLRTYICTDMRAYVRIAIINSYMYKFCQLYIDLQKRA